MLGTSSTFSTTAPLVGTIKKVAHIEVERIKKMKKWQLRQNKILRAAGSFLFLTTKLSLPRIKMRMETRDRKLEPGDLRQEM